MDLKKHIRSILDYPKKGILFRDITTLIKNADAFKFTNDKIIEIDRQFIDQYYQQDRIVCDVCQPNRKQGKYYKKNAKFIVKDYGIVLSCRRCNQSYPLNKYLQQAHNDSTEHSIARWKIGSTGWNFNCPHPPKDFLDQEKKKRREAHRKQEESLKKMNYLRKYGKLP